MGPIYKRLWCKKLIKEFPDKGWASSSLNKLLNYLNIFAR